MRWRIPLSWLLGATPLCAMVAADDMRVRVFIFLLGILFILGSMVFAQDDGAEAERRKYKDKEEAQ